jgi:alpha-ketoglutarate-dependent taurine dioxygenase
MSTSPKSPPKLGSISRRRVTLSEDRLLETERLSDDSAIPLLVRPGVEGVDLVDWATTHRQRIDQLLLEHRALLFRGFGVDGVEKLQRFAGATSDGEPLRYVDRSTPRYTVGEGVYISTIYPPHESIRLHNEGTYWSTWARKIYFSCLIAAERGGQTPIADTRGVYRRLSSAVRDRFEELGVMYVRNYNDGLGMPWQEVFQTDDREEVEEYFRANSIEGEWKDGGRLRTRQVRPAVRHHPVTGEPLWFNHGAFFHVTSLAAETRDALLADFEVEDLPYNTYFGDGSPIPPEVVEEIRQAYEAEKVLFDWQAGDIMLLDNMTVAHGREPYEGDRKVVVVMTEPETGAAD